MARHCLCRLAARAAESGRAAWANSGPCPIHRAVARQSVHGGAFLPIALVLRTSSPEAFSKTAIQMLACDVEWLSKGRQLSCLCIHSFLDSRRTRRPFGGPPSMKITRRWQGQLGCIVASLVVGILLGIAACHRTTAPSPDIGAGETP